MAAMPEVRLAASVCVHRVGHALVGFHRRKGGWEFPGGRQEGSESLAQAAARECYEEVGIRPEEGRLETLGFIERDVNKAGERWLTIAFAYECSTEEQAAACAKEADGLNDLGWWTFAEMKRGMPLTKGMKLVVERLGDQLADVLSERLSATTDREALHCSPAPKSEAA